MGTGVTPNGPTHLISGNVQEQGTHARALLLQLQLCDQMCGDVDGPEFGRTDIHKRSLSYLRLDCRSQAMIVVDRCGDTCTAVHQRSKKWCSLLALHESSSRDVLLLLLLLLSSSGNRSISEHITVNRGRHDDHKLPATEA